MESVPVLTLDPLLCVSSLADNTVEAAVSNRAIKTDETTQVIQLIIHVPVVPPGVFSNALALLVFHCKQNK